MKAGASGAARDGRSGAARGMRGCSVSSSVLSWSRSAASSFAAVASAAGGDAFGTAARRWGSWGRRTRGRRPRWRRRSGRRLGCRLDAEGGSDGHDSCRRVVDCRHWDCRLNACSPGRRRYHSVSGARLDRRPRDNLLARRWPLPKRAYPRRLRQGSGAGDRVCATSAAVGGATRGTRGLFAMAG